MKYVLISSSSDYHIPFVEKHLDEPFTIIDWQNIPEGIPGSFVFNHDGLVLEWSNKKVDGVRSVWFRKPVEIAPVHFKLKKEDAIYAATALNQFNQLLLTYFSDAFWISDYYAIRRAMSKTVQLQLAKRIGFRVPETLITSSPEAAKAFVDSHRATIVKPIDVQSYPKGDKKFLFLTRNINKKTISYDGLHLAPAIFQEAISVGTDIRVTVVGDHVFAATITGSALRTGSKRVRDWRIVHHRGDMVVKEYQLPQKIARLCVLHVRELGLAFGAIDLVLDRKGVYWFLENNPNGQWAFVEEATGQPIGKAIAQLLTQWSS